MWNRPQTRLKLVPMYSPKLQEHFHTTPVSISRLYQKLGRLCFVKVYSSFMPSVVCCGMWVFLYLQIRRMGVQVVLRPSPLSLLLHCLWKKTTMTAMTSADLSTVCLTKVTWHASNWYSPPAKSNPYCQIPFQSPWVSFCHLSSLNRPNKQISQPP